MIRENNVFFLEPLRSVNRFTPRLSPMESYVLKKIWRQVYSVIPTTYSSKNEHTC